MTVARDVQGGRPCDITLPKPETPVDPMARCATATAEVVRAVIATLTREHGRSATIVSLQMLAQDLARSALGEHQVQRSAFAAAADDLAWGRTPLDAWLGTMCDPTAAPADQRAVVRATLPNTERATAQAAAALVVRAIDARADAKGSEGRAEYLDAARSLQTGAFDDPRLDMPPSLRAVMRRSGELLGARARPATDPFPAVAARPAPDWRRWLPWRR